MPRKLTFKKTANKAPSHKQLTLRERKHIELALRRGESQAKIAGELKRSQSSIAREIKRNSYAVGNYVATIAQRKAERKTKAQRSAAGKR